VTAKHPFRWARLGLALWLVLGLAACQRSTPAASPQQTVEPVADLQAQAAAEATAIIQQAQATALLLQAQAQATALIQQAQGREPASTAPASRALPVLTPTPGGPAEEESTPAPAAGSPEATAGVTGTATVELLGVGFAADGAYIIANYKAPPVAAQTFWPGVLSVTDEASGTVFNEVPVMPVIGPLIARPVQEGQIGYVMLVHNPPLLRSGALVTVDLADYHFEHVPVQ
jgi:hypothetical protein